MGTMRDRVVISRTVLPPLLPKIASLNSKGTLDPSQIGIGNPNDNMQLSIDPVTSLPKWRRSFTEIELDFGYVNATGARFIIVDANVKSTSRIRVLASGNAATDRVGNDFEWDQIQFSAIPGSGQFILCANVINGSVVGKRKVLYGVA